MGYSPMYHNEVAAQYGNRVQATRPLIRANPPVFPVTASRITDRRKDGDTHASYQQSHRYVTGGKGDRFDELA